MKPESQWSSESSDYGNITNTPARTSANSRRANLREQRRRRELLYKKKIRRNRIAFSLFIAGVFLLIYFTFNNTAFKEGLDKVAAFFNEASNVDVVDGKPKDVVEDMNLNSIDVNNDNENINDVNDKIFINLDAEDLHRGDLALVNDVTPLPAGFKPNKLINLYKARTPGIYGLKDSSIELEESAFARLDDLLTAMKEANAGDIVIVSGFRTYNYQQNLLNEEVKLHLRNGLGEEEANAKALQLVARPGRSEHNYGYAIDFSASENGNLLSENFENTTQGEWLINNSWKYGYILRYALDKVDITGINYEPWHYRYVGYPHSAVMKKMNLSLEEYIHYIIDNKSINAFMNNDSEYYIYYVDTKDLENEYDEDGKLSFKVPLPSAYGSESDIGYDPTKVSISGDGAKGFIITIKK